MTLKELRESNQNRCEVCVWFETDHDDQYWCTNGNDWVAVTQSFICTAFDRKDSKSSGNSTEYTMPLVNGFPEFVGDVLALPFDLWAWYIKAIRQKKWVKVFFVSLLFLIIFMVVVSFIIFAILMGG